MTQGQLSMRTPQGWVSVLLMITLLAIVGYWASRLFAPVVAIAPVVVSAAPSNHSLSANGQRLFGQPAPAVAATTTVVPDSQIQVAGVIVQAQSPSKTAARTDQRSVALLAVDGKPPKPFSIGQTVTTGVTLTRVSAQEVVVTRNGAEVKLQPPKTGDISVLTAGKSASTTPSTYPPTPPAGSTSFTPPPPPVAATVNTPSTSAGKLNPAPAGPAPIQTSPAASQPNIGQQVAEPAPTTTQDGSQPPTVGGSMRAGPPR